VYYKEGYDEREKISLTLDQALQAVKSKKRTLSIDGIYSILGLLPYGEQVKVKYEKWGHKYTKKELQKVLLDVMKVAVTNGYAEPLSWHGEGGGD